MIKTIKVSDKGQIAIPHSMREKAGIRRGDKLIIAQSGKRIFIEKTDRMSRRINDDFKDMLKHSEQSLKEVWGNSKDDLWGRYLK